MEDPKQDKATLFPVKNDQKIVFRNSLTEIPRTLTTLHLGNYFNEPIDWIVDVPVENLQLGYHFNQKITKVPPTLKILNLGGCFRHPIDFLADSQLVELRLSDCFDLVITKLPPTLKVVNLGYFYNHPIDFLADYPITHIRLSKCFNQKITKLPSTLKIMIVYDAKLIRDLFIYAKERKIGTSLKITNTCGYCVGPCPDHRTVEFASN